LKEAVGRESSVQCNHSVAEDHKYYDNVMNEMNVLDRDKQTN
jgi:hypothetical protein